MDHSNQCQYTRLTITLLQMKKKNQVYTEVILNYADTNKHIRTLKEKKL